MPADDTTNPEITALRERISELSKESAGYRTKLREAETRVAELEGEVKTTGTKLAKAADQLSSFQLRDKRIAAVAARRTAFEKDAANVGKTVDWERTNAFIERVNRDAETLDKDLDDALVLFTAASEKPKSTIITGNASTDRKPDARPAIGPLGRAVLASAGITSDQPAE